MSEVDSNDFVCEYSREKHENGVSSSELENDQRDRGTIPNLNNILLKNKCCLTVCIETLEFYYLLLQHMEGYKFFPINV